MARGSRHRDNHRLLMLLIGGRLASRNLKQKEPITE
jgi:hypothetical protein